MEIELEELSFVGNIMKNIKRYIHENGFIYYISILKDTMDF